MVASSSGCSRPYSPDSFSVLTRSSSPARKKQFSRVGGSVLVSTALPWLPPSRKLHALDLRRLAYDFLPEDGLCVSTWLRLLVLRQHDGSATHLCRTLQNNSTQLPPHAPKSRSS